MVAGHFVANAASARVMAKLGFVDTGDRVTHCRALDRELASRAMVLTPDAWQRLSNPG